MQRKEEKRKLFISISIFFGVCLCSVIFLFYSLINVFLKRLLLPASHSQHPQRLPADPAPRSPGGQWHHALLQRHPHAHPAHLPVRHLVAAERRGVRGHPDVRPPGRRGDRAQVHPALRRREHPIGPWEGRPVWTGDIESDHVWRRDLWVQRNGVDTWEWREMDQNRGEHERDGDCECYPYR